jgi:hypothetical protein
MQKNETISIFLTIHKTNQNKNLNRRTETMKCLKISKAQATKGNGITLKFCTANKSERQPTKKEKIFTNYTSDKQLLPEYIRY